MKHLKLFYATLLMLTLWLVQTPYKASAQYPPPLPNAQPQDFDRIAALRIAGICSDRTQIPTLLSALQHPVKYLVLPQEIEIETALHALAQLGAVQAVPAIDTLLKETTRKDVRDYAQAAKARLLAEAKAQNIADSAAQARTKVDEFYKQLGTTPIEFKRATDRLIGREYSDRYIGTVEFYALRELADMIYRGNYKDYMSLAIVKTLDFSKDEVTALKLKVAQVPKPERAGWLINYLSEKKILVGDAHCAIQLALDEGKVASQAAAAKLKEMNTNREKYMGSGKQKSHMPFEILLIVLEYSGDKEQKDTVELFRNDADTWIQSEAEKALYSVQDGLRMQYVPGY